MKATDVIALHDLAKEAGLPISYDQILRNLAAQEGSAPSAAPAALPEEAAPVSSRVLSTRDIGRVRSYVRAIPVEARFTVEKLKHALSLPNGRSIKNILRGMREQNEVAKDGIDQHGHQLYYRVYQLASAA